MTIKKDGHYEQADITDPEVQKAFGLRRSGRNLVTDDAEATIIHTLDDQELAACEAKEQKS